MTRRRAPVHPVDQLQFHFDPGSVRALELALATVVFGAALDLRIADLRRIAVSPRGPAIGLLAQFVLLPALASLAIWILRPAPSIGLGLLLVAACPGGASSNFFAMLARGNVALSVTLSAVSTLTAILMTPLNFVFWGSTNPATAPLLHEIQVDPLAILRSGLLTLIAPTLAAMAVRRWRERLADRLLTPVRVAGAVLMISFIAGGFLSNASHLGHLREAAVIVLLVNSAGLATGYWLSRLAGLPHYDAKSVSIETGIQNIGFGLVLVFQFFGGLGGMALVVGWWGVWHSISALALSLYWARAAKRLHPSAAPALSL
jgi:bile acid:Na+ symporter, BASS family